MPSRKIISPQYISLPRKKVAAGFDLGFWLILEVHLGFLDEIFRIVFGKRGHGQPHALCAVVGFQSSGNNFPSSLLHFSIICYRPLGHVKTLLAHFRRMPRTQSHSLWGRVQCDSADRGIG